jgi:hypothetical protein
MKADSRACNKTSLAKEIFRLRSMTYIPHL